MYFYNILFDLKQRQIVVITAGTSFYVAMLGETSVQNSPAIVLDELPFAEAG